MLFNASQFCFVGHHSKVIPFQVVIGNVIHPLVVDGAPQSSQIKFGLSEPTATSRSESSARPSNKPPIVESLLVVETDFPQVGNRCTPSYTCFRPRRCSTWTSGAGILAVVHGSRFVRFQVAVPSNRKIALSPFLRNWILAVRLYWT
jgi:hypothetical protein